MFGIRLDSSFISVMDDQFLSVFIHCGLVFRTMTMTMTMTLNCFNSDLLLLPPPVGH